MAAELKMLTQRNQLPHHYSTRIDNGKSVGSLEELKYGPWQQNT